MNWQNLDIEFYFALFKDLSEVENSERVGLHLIDDLSSIFAMLSLNYPVRLYFEIFLSAEQNFDVPSILNYICN